MLLIIKHIDRKTVPTGRSGSPLRSDKTAGLQDCITAAGGGQTFRLSDSQTLRLSDSQTFRLSDPQTLRPSDPQTLRLSDPQNYCLK